MGSPLGGSSEKDASAKKSLKRKRPSEWDGEKEEEEIEKKARLTIEEALANFKIRTCPKCHVRFTKGPGCNMIQCVCGHHFCFRCGKDNSVGHRACSGTRRRPRDVVRNACKTLLKRHPQLTFRQCCQIVAKSWTKKDEAEELGRCDNDSDDDSDELD